MRKVVALYCVKSMAKDCWADDFALYITVNVEATKRLENCFRSNQRHTRLTRLKVARLTARWSHQLVTVCWTDQLTAVIAVEMTPAQSAITGRRTLYNHITRINHHIINHQCQHHECRAAYDAHHLRVVRFLWCLSCIQLWDLVGETAASRGVTGTV